MSSGEYAVSLVSGEPLRDAASSEDRGLLVGTEEPLALILLDDPFVSTTEKWGVARLETLLDNRIIYT